MKENVSPSNEPISGGLIGKINDLLGAALRKSGLPLHPTQEVVEEQGAAIVAACVAEIRKRVGVLMNLITRVVTVNARAPRAALETTGRRLYVTESVVTTMPKGQEGEAPVYFFKPDASAYDKNGLISVDDVEKQFDLCGLKPVDPYRLAAVNEADPAFADDHPNVTQWKDAEDNWCYASFDRWCGERSVDVGRGGKWSDRWWFAGVRK